MVRFQKRWKTSTICAKNQTKFESGIPQRESVLQYHNYMRRIEPQTTTALVNHRRRPPTTSPLPLQNPLFVWASKGRFRPIFHVNCLQKCQPISHNRMKHVDGGGVRPIPAEAADIYLYQHSPTTRTEVKCWQRRQLLCGHGFRNKTQVPLVRRNSAPNI